MKNIYRRVVQLPTCASSNRGSYVRVLLIWIWALPSCNVRCQREFRWVVYSRTQVVCTVYKSACRDETTFLYSANATWQPLRLSSQPTCMLMDSCGVHDTSSIKEALGRFGTTSYTYQEVIRASNKCLMLVLAILLNYTCASSTRVSWEEVQEKPLDCT